MDRDPSDLKIEVKLEVSTRVTRQTDRVEYFLLLKSPPQCFNAGFRDPPDPKRSRS